MLFRGVIRTAMQGVPDELAESASLDGANELVILFRIILPMVKPTLAAIALFWPLSGAVLILTSLWFPCSLSLLAIYPALNKSFDLEAKIKAMRDAQLDSHDED